MHAAGVYQHVYWAGVALMLLAEVEARKSGASIDDWVRASRARFPNDDRAHSADEILAPSRNIGKESVASAAVARAFAANRRATFPSTDAVLADLGVKRAKRGVILDDTAPLASIRKAITVPAP